MANIFGTDGIRGIANQELTPELALGLGRAAFGILSGKGKGKFLVGRDTRNTGEMLETALASGIASSGGQALMAGVLTTPCLAYLLSTGEYVGGAMVSASHNPAEYNGIKFMDSQGFKLRPETETQISELYLSEVKDPVSPFDVGRVESVPGVERSYISHLAASVGHIDTGLKLVVDLANGAAAGLGPQVFEELGLTVEFLGNSPDGYNINRECGCLHLDYLRHRVLEVGADAGFALDGDADRVLAVDDRGQVVDGDHIMAIMGLDMAQRGDLPADTVVATVMSNGGLELCLDQAGIRLVRVGVGDRLVQAEMVRLGAALGGEQSGHIIFSRRATTGDGLLTSLMVLEVMSRRQRTLSDLRDKMVRLPQVTRNVPVASREGWKEDPSLRAMLLAAERDLGPGGRILVRPSGTEPVIRIMVEGRDEDQIQHVAGHLEHEIVRVLGGGESTG